MAKPKDDSMLNINSDEAIEKYPYGYKTPEKYFREYFKKYVSAEEAG